MARPYKAPRQTVTIGISFAFDDARDLDRMAKRHKLNRSQMLRKLLRLGMGIVDGQKPDETAAVA